MKNFETLEVGKTYKNRNGGLVKITCRETFVVPYVGYFGDATQELYKADGTWFMDSESMDLVELMVEPGYQTIEYYELSSPDGAGERDIVEAYVSSEAVATQWVMLAKGWPRNFKKKTLVIANSLEAIQQIKDQEVRQRAINKLTDAELAALGLTRK